MMVARHSMRWASALRRERWHLYDYLRLTKFQQLELEQFGSATLQAPLLDSLPKILHH